MIDRGGRKRSEKLGLSEKGGCPRWSEDQLVSSSEEEGTLVREVCFS